MDGPAHPLVSPSRQASPLVGLDVQHDPNANGSGKVVALQYVPFGSLFIPVYAASGFTRQDFDGSAAYAQDGGTAGDPNADPRPWDVSVMATAQATSLLTAAAYWQLRWWVKGAAYQTPIRLLDPTFNTKRNGQVVVASAVQIVLYGVTNQAAGVVAPQQWVCGIAPALGMSFGAERFNWQWAYQEAGGFAASIGTLWDMTNGIGGTGNPFQQAGCVGQWKCTLVANPGGTLLYPMLLDNSIPIAGSVLNPVQNAGDAQSYGDEFRPGTVSFGGHGNTLTKLQAALSTTPDVFTAPAQAATASVLAKVGT